MNGMQAPRFDKHRRPLRSTAEGGGGGEGGDKRSKCSIEAAADESIRQRYPADGDGDLLIYSSDASAVERH